MDNVKIQVAIADDHTLLRKGLADLIDSFGPFKVIMEAGHGLELLDKLNAATALPDVCILDINMPELDGFGTLVQIKKKWPDMKVWPYLCITMSLLSSVCCAMVPMAIC